MPTVRLVHSEKSLSSLYLNKKRSRSQTSLNVTSPSKKPLSQRIERTNQDISTPTMPTTPSPPYEPGAEEKKLYFFGLRGCPKLVARTSAHPWSPPMKGAAFRTRIRKVFSPVSQHDVVIHWSHDLASALVDALETSPWSYFLPIRIGLEDSEEREEIRAFERTNHPVVLLIAMESDNLSWNDAISIATKCRGILQSHRILDVQVEMLEGRYKDCAASRALETQVQQDAWTNTRLTSNTNILTLPMLSYPGYPVTYLSNPHIQGTIGAHFKLQGDDSTVYGLTCRHVVSSDRRDNESYTLSDQPLQHHAQLSVTTYRKLLEAFEEHHLKLQYSQTRLLEKRKDWEEWYSTSPTKKDKKGLVFTANDGQELSKIEKEIEYHLQIFGFLRTLDTPQARTFGHLAYHSDLNMSDQEPGWLKDWGLIQLDGSKFLDGPQNKIFLGNKFEQVCVRERLDRLDYENFLALTLERRGPELPKAFLVAKQGATSNLTFGTQSAVEAVVRKPTDSGGSFICWEAPIISFSRTDNFSSEGDSGSCVFDLEGRIVGLVTGRAVAKTIDRKYRLRPDQSAQPQEVARSGTDTMPDWDDETDITFSTPINWVLEDIERFTGRRPQLC